MPPPTAPAPRLEAPRPVVRSAHPGAQSLHANLLDSTKNMPFLARPESVVQYTALPGRSADPPDEVSIDAGCPRLL